MDEIERVRKTIAVLKTKNRIELLIERLVQLDDADTIVAILELAVKKLEELPPDERGANQDLNVAISLMEKE